MALSVEGWKGRWYLWCFKSACGHDSVMLRSKAWKYWCSHGTAPCSAGSSARWLERAAEASLQVGQTNANPSDCCYIPRSYPPLIWFLRNETVLVLRDLTTNYFLQLISITQLRKKNKKQLCSENVHESSNLAAWPTTATWKNCNCPLLAPFLFKRK